MLILGKDEILWFIEDCNKYLVTDSHCRFLTRSLGQYIVLPILRQLHQLAIVPLPLTICVIITPLRLRWQTLDFAFPARVLLVPKEGIGL